MCAMMYPQKEDITDLPFLKEKYMSFLKNLAMAMLFFTPYNG